MPRNDALSNIENVAGTTHTEPGNRTVVGCVHCAHTKGDGICSGECETQSY